MKNTFSIVMVLGLFGSLFSACNHSAPNNGAEKPLVDPTEQNSTAFALEIVEETDAEGNLIRFSRRDSDELREGVFTKTAPQGIKLETANYHEGKLHGQRVLFYPNGDSLILETYENGDFEGIYKAFHPTGKLKTLGTYHQNQIEGKWMQYYETGQLKEVVLFQNGEENGPFKEYHPNGQLSVEGTYKDGDNENGLLKFYDEKGQHYKTMDCKMAICRTIWSQENNKAGKSKNKKRKS
jgi:antitoxin component YwqK of YwqJK toxin-antitoxin module